MMRLITTTGCPTIDAELAHHGDVVLRATERELILLRYSMRFRSWYACGCLSVAAASVEEHPREAELYWQNIGYLESAACAYAMFPDKPARAAQRWNAFYDQVSSFESLRPLWH